MKGKPDISASTTRPVLSILTLKVLVTTIDALRHF